MYAAACTLAAVHPVVQPIAGSAFYATRTYRWLDSHTGRRNVTATIRFAADANFVVFFTAGRVHAEDIIPPLRKVLKGIPDRNDRTGNMLAQGDEV